MKDSVIKARIIENKEISNNIYKMRLEGDFEGKPGQFYMLRAWEGLEPFLSRPISIYNKNEKSIEFLYEDRGIGTNLMSKLKRDEYIKLLGPLGNSFPTIKTNNIALVAGGIGIAPLVYLCKELKKEGKKIDFYAGFREESYVMDEIKNYADNIYISTESGKEGYKGYVVDLIDYGKYEDIISCGPMIMMKRIIENKKDTIVSMEERMACGIGACMGCNIETREGNKKVCKDGPIFKGEELLI